MIRLISIGLKSAFFKCFRISPYQKKCDLQESIDFDNRGRAAFVKFSFDARLYPSKKSVLIVSCSYFDGLSYWIPLDD